MKRYFATILILLAMAAVPATAMTKQQNVRWLFEKYHDAPGGDCVKVGSMLIKLGKMFSDEDDKDAKVLDMVSEIVVLDLEESPDNIRGSFRKDCARLLEDTSGYQLLMQAKDEGEELSIYVSTDNDGNIRELILVSDEDPALIYIKGQIPPEYINETINSSEAYID